MIYDFSDLFLSEIAKVIAKKSTKNYEIYGLYFVRVYS